MLSLFNKYNESACLFECRLAYAATRAKCIPWDYPVPGLGNLSTLPMCVASKVIGQKNAIRNFEDLMSSKKSAESCNCLPNCEEVSFKTQVDCTSNLLFNMTNTYVTANQRGYEHEERVLF